MKPEGKRRKFPARRGPIKFAVAEQGIGGAAGRSPAVPLCIPADSASTDESHGAATVGTAAAAAAPPSTSPSLALSAMTRSEMPMIPEGASVGLTSGVDPAVSAACGEPNAESHCKGKRARGCCFLLRASCACRMRVTSCCLAKTRTAGTVGVRGAVGVIRAHSHHTGDY
jgi:hypothetical protein